MSAKYPHLIAGQLLTPLTFIRPWSTTYAIDNGAFSTFKEDKWWRLVTLYGADALFVVLPDVVGDANRTAQLWEEYKDALPGVRKAFALQDGCIQVPADAQCVFLGGSTGFKMSRQAADLLLHASHLGMHTHVGRVNTPNRYLHFKALGVDTCDGTGILRFPHMLPAIARMSQIQPFWEK